MLPSHLSNPYPTPTPLPPAYQGDADALERTLHALHSLPARHTSGQILHKEKRKAPEGTQATSQTLDDVAIQPQPELLQKKLWVWVYVCHGRSSQYCSNRYTIAWLTSSFALDINWLKHMWLTPARPPSKGLPSTFAATIAPFTAFFAAVLLL